MANELVSGLSKAIIRGSQLAVSLAKTCITTPVLINTDIKQGAQYAIPLYVETNQKSAAAEVSESLIISTESKKNITDNVAPGSKSWHLTGYIKGDISGILEPTNYFQPITLFYADTLWEWFGHAAVLMFKDGNAQVYDRVVIKDLQTGMQKDSQSAIPFSMTLKEINVMTTSPLNLPADTTNSAEAAAKSAPDAGSAGGNTLSMGATSSQS